MWCRDILLRLSEELQELNPSRHSVEGRSYRIAATDGIAEVGEVRRVRSRCRSGSHLEEPNRIQRPPQENEKDSERDEQREMAYEFTDSDPVGFKWGFRAPLPAVPDETINDVSGGQECSRPEPSRCRRSN